LARDNRLLGTFNLEGIPPAPRGMPQIEVTFNIDVNGILAVSAKGSGHTKGEQDHRPEFRRTEQGRDREDEARCESHAAEDKKRREVIDLKNQGESAVYQTEKQLKEHGDKVSADIRGNIESAVNNLKDALKSDDGDRIRRRSRISRPPRTSSARRFTRPPVRRHRPVQARPPSADRSRNNGEKEGRRRDRRRV